MYNDELIKQERGFNMKQQIFSIGDTVGGTCNATGYCFSVNERCFGLFRGFGPGWTVADLVSGSVLCSGFDTIKEAITTTICRLVRCHFNGWKPTAQNMNPHARPNLGLQYWITTSGQDGGV